MYTVLIVDDEETEREGVLFLLTRRGLPLTVYQAKNGAEALSFLSGQSADLLITDVKMPVMNGLELCRHIRETDDKMVILILSAYGDFEFTRSAIRTRVDDYILKPVVIEEFDRAIDRALLTLGAGEPTEEQELSGTLSENRIVRDVQKLTEDNFSKNIGLEWIADQLCLSAGYLGSVYKRVTGKPFTQYLTALRMEKAKQYLIKTNMKIVDVGEAVGYTNPSYFCLQFRKYFGVTANAMRERGMQ